MFRRRMHEANLQAPQLRNGAVAIRLQHLKPRRKRLARPEHVFFRHQGADTRAFERAPGETCFEACVEYGDGQEPFVISHARSIG